MYQLSIVIPCYNSGVFLAETLESIQSYTGTHRYEVILIDDGSTDKDTQEYLNTCSQISNYRVIHQPNLGPAAARNTGVKYASSDYILFLDSDNKIYADIFIDKGIAVLNEDPEIGVFYGNPSFFGNVTDDRIFKSAIFNLETIWCENYVDMCSMIRKSVWQEVGGLDENRLLIGHEDWDFWIRVGRTKWKFYYIDHVLFEYRVSKKSLVTQSASSSNYEKMVRYIYRKHSDILPQHLLEWCVSPELQQ